MVEKRQTRRQAVSGHKRELILDAAKQVFAEEGLEGASLRAIAVKAGYTPLLHRALRRPKATLAAAYGVAAVLLVCGTHIGADFLPRIFEGAFAIDAKRRDRLTNRHVVLVDDVYTSGATTEACTRVLLRGGAKKVTILCWARVLGEGAAD